jgi:hypothetical protein
MRQPISTALFETWNTPSCAGRSACARDSVQGEMPDSGQFADPVHANHHTGSEHSSRDNDGASLQFPPQER